MQPKQATDEGVAPAQKRFGSHMFGKVLLVALLMSALGAVVWHDINENTRFWVKCEAFPGGYDCYASHDQAEAKDLNVCWELHLICKNGERVKAGKCIRAVIPPKANANGKLAKSDFKGIDRCDEVSQTAVEKATAYPGWTSSAIAEPR